MPDRIIRDSLLTSDAWLGVKDNADRVAYLSLLLTADTFGNQPAGPYRLIHQWRPYGIDNPEKVAKVLLELSEAGLVRTYQIDGKAYVHIPRFNQSRRFLGRLNPVPPWSTPEEKQAFTKKSQVNHRSPPVILREPPEGVGVGVGVGVGEKQFNSLVVADAPTAVSTPVREKAGKATRLPKDWFIPDDWKEWAVKAHHLDPQKVVRISLVFRDFWHAKAGKDACKLDWLATWRNWIRRECGDA